MKILDDARSEDALSEDWLSVAQVALRLLVSLESFARMDTKADAGR